MQGVHVSAVDWDNSFNCVTYLNNDHNTVATPRDLAISLPPIPTKKANAACAFQEIRMRGGPACLALRSSPKWTISSAWVGWLMGFESVFGAFLETILCNLSIFKSQCHFYYFVLQMHFCFILLYVYICIIAPFSRQI